MNIQRALRICATAVFFGLAVPRFVDASSTKTVYSVVFDAGSSGSRLRVYIWQARLQRYVLPNITEVFAYKVRPGISAFVDDVGGLKAHVRDLLRRSANFVPPQKYATTRVYLMATAGMRLILEDRAAEMMEKINEVMLNTSVNPFLYHPLNCRILSGEEEGVFAWIATNYLTGFLVSEAQTSTSQPTGIIEMGGASLQIAFHTRRPILADKFPLKITGKRIPIYVHSYLHYGQDYLDIWLKRQLMRRILGDGGAVPTAVDNPCMLVGHTLREKFDNRLVTFNGTGDPMACETLLKDFVYKDEANRCSPKPCSIGTVYQPSIREQQRFVALSAFRFTLETLAVLQADDSFTPNATRHSAYAYCQQTVAEALNGPLKNDPLASTQVSASCLIGLFIPLLLTKGFGFDENTRRIFLKNEIAGYTPEWSLGALIYETERLDWQCPSEKPSSSQLQFANGGTSLGDTTRQIWSIVTLTILTTLRFHTRLQTYFAERLI